MQVCRYSARALELFPVEREEELDAVVSGLDLAPVQEGTSVSFLFGPHARLPVAASRAWQIGDLRNFSERIFQPIKNQHGFLELPLVPAVPATLRLLEVGFPSVLVLIVEFSLEDPLPPPDADAAFAALQGVRLWLDSLGGLTRGNWAPRTPVVTDIQVQCDAAELAAVVSRLKAGEGRERPDDLKFILPAQAFASTLVDGGADGTTLSMPGTQAAFNGQLCPITVQFVSARRPIMKPPNLLIPGAPDFLGFSTETGLALSILGTWALWAWVRAREIEASYDQTREALADFNSAEDEADSVLTSLTPLGSDAANLRSQLGLVIRRFSGTLTSLAATSQSHVAARMPLNFGNEPAQSFLGSSPEDILRRLGEAAEFCDAVDTELSRITSYTMTRVTLRTNQTIERLTVTLVWLTVILAILTLVLVIRA